MGVRVAGPAELERFYFGDFWGLFVHKRMILKHCPQNTMKRTFSAVHEKRLVPSGVNDTLDDDAVDDKDDRDYWSAALGVEAHVHQLFARVKIVFGNNDETAFYKHVDVALTIKELKDRIKRKKMVRTVIDYPINLRVQISPIMCKMVGAAIRNVQDGDGTPAVDAEEQQKMDDKTLQEVLASCPLRPYLVGHELVDQDAKQKNVLHWCTLR